MTKKTVLSEATARVQYWFLSPLHSQWICNTDLKKVVSMGFYQTNSKLSGIH